MNKDEQYLLKVENLAKSFQLENQKIDILSKVNFQLERGKIHALIGPSGSGKSTLLTMLAGIDLPDRGDIYFNETNLTALSSAKRHAFRAKNIGFVFQQFHLIDHYTALENAALFLEMMDDDKAEEKASSLLKEMGLEQRMNHFPTQLSGGENQRVAIARAMVYGPELIIADEPTGSLDLKTGQVITDLLFKLVREKNKTLLLVTHNEELAKQVDHLFEVKEGRICDV